MGRVNLVISMVAIYLLSSAVVLGQSDSPASTTAVPSFLYAPSVSENDISAYAIDSTTGSLTPIAGSPFAASNSVYMTLDSDSNFAYVGGASAVSTFAINSQTGFLTLVNTLPAQTRDVSGLTLTPKDGFAYVANNLGVVGYEVDRESGFLTDIAQPQIVLGGGLARGTVHPSGKFAYFSYPALNSVSAYALNPGKGTLTPIPGSPFSAGNLPGELAADPCGQFLYVINTFSNDVSAYAIDQEIGSLAPVPGSPFSAQRQPLGVTIDPLGRFVFVANAYSDSVSVYAIDRPTGSLTQVSGSPFPTGRNPVAVGVHPSGKFVYAANFDVLPTNVSSVSGFALDSITGALTPVPGSPFLAGRNPNGIAITGQRQGCRNESVDAQSVHVDSDANASGFATHNERRSVKLRTAASLIASSWLLVGHKGAGCASCQPFVSLLRSAPRPMVHNPDSGKADAEERECAWFWHWCKVSLEPKVSRNLVPLGASE